MRGPSLVGAGVALGGLLGLCVAGIPGWIGRDASEAVVVGAVSGAVTGAFLGYWEWIPRRRRWDLARRLPSPLRGLYAGLLAAPASAGLLMLGWVLLSGKRIVSQFPASFLLAALSVEHLHVTLPVGLLLGLGLWWARRRRPASPDGE